MKTADRVIVFQVTKYLTYSRKLVSSRMNDNDIHKHVSK